MTAKGQMASKIAPEMARCRQTLSVNHDVRHIWLRKYIALRTTETVGTRGRRGTGCFLLHIESGNEQTTHEIDYSKENRAQWRYLEILNCFRIIPSMLELVFIFHSSKTALLLRQA